MQGQGREQGVSRLVVLALAAALCVGGAVALGLVVGKSNSDVTVARLAIVGAVLALLGPCAAAGLNLAARRPRLAWLGYLTLLAGAFAVVSVSIRVLEGSGFFFGGEASLQTVAVALALASGQLSLALAYGRDDDPPALRFLSYGTAIAVLVIGLLFAFQIVKGDTDAFTKLYGVLFVIWLLGAALLTLFRLADWFGRRLPAWTSPDLRLDHTVIAVSDRAAAAHFYGTLLGAETVERSGGRIAFRVGDQLLNVHETGVEATPLAREPVRPGNSDLCFVWPGSPELAVATIRELGAELVDGPVLREGAAGPGTSVYTRDPDGSLIELISYA
jgi:catechol 2,3-dioxygenase-like lactoylglutathione lyase family enzyme